MINIIKQSILIQWVSWQFFEVPKSILKAWRNFLLFNLHYFSIPLLLKTFFSHWRRYRWSYGRGLDLGRYFSVFFSNLISRILGAVMRTFLIVTGLAVEFLVVLGGIIVLLFWLILPLLLIAGFCLGLIVIF